MEEKKAQKHLLRINEALYRVTDLLDDQEPVKWTLRKKAMEAFDLFSEDSPALALAARMKKRDAFASVVHHLIDVLEFASHNTFISRINFEVLSREYRAFLQDARAMETAPQQEQNIVEELLKISSLASPNLGGPASPAGRPVPLLKQKKSSILKQETNAEMNTAQRRARILSFVTQNREGITMQELSKIFKGTLHLRTLQRDLTELIGQGKIRAEGERRWRRYSVV